jgi:hypothetical protein
MPRDAIPPPLTVIRDIRMRSDESEAEAEEAAEEPEEEEVEVAEEERAEGWRRGTWWGRCRDTGRHREPVDDVRYRPSLLPRGRRLMGAAAPLVVQGVQ